MIEDKEKAAAAADDSDYDSGEDADFHDSDGSSEGSSDESDAAPARRGADQDLDSGDEATISKRRKRRKVAADTNADDPRLTRAQKRGKYDLDSFGSDNLELRREAQPQRRRL